MNMTRTILMVMLLALLGACNSDKAKQAEQVAEYQTTSESSDHKAMDKKKRKGEGKRKKGEGKRGEGKKKGGKKGPKTNEQLGMADNPNNVLGGLKVGDIAPNFSLKDQNGKTVDLHQMLNEKEVAITFYRGSWCPHCTRQMSAFTADLDKLTAANVELLAISPETQDWSQEYTKRADIKFPILEDTDHSVSRAYKGFYHVTDQYRERVMQGLEKDIASQNGDKTAMLNVPATYLIGKDKKIKYAFYNVDYSKRASIDDIVAAI